MARGREATILFLALGLAAFGVTNALGSESNVTPAPPTIPTVPDAVEYVEVGTTVSPVVAELPESVAAVLIANGKAGLTPEAALSEELPESVVAVLLDQGSVLVVPDGVEP
jgi:hypothetical protein